MGLISKIFMVDILTLCFSEAPSGRLSTAFCARASRPDSFNSRIITLSSSSTYSLYLSNSAVFWHFDSTTAFSYNTEQTIETLWHSMYVSRGNVLGCQIFHKLNWIIYFPTLSLHYMNLHDVKLQRRLNVESSYPDCFQRTTLTLINKICIVQN